MIIEITKNGYGSRVLDDDGKDIANALGVRSITVECEVDKPTVAIMELIHIDRVFVSPEKVEYSIAGHSDVRGLLLADGRIVFLPGAYPGEFGPGPEVKELKIKVDMPDDRRMAGAHQEINESEKL